MQRRFIAFTLLLGLALAGCQSPKVAPKEEGVRIADDVTVQSLADDVWVFTAYFDVPETGRVGANGLVIISDREAVLVNVPWTDEQTAALFDWIEEKQSATVKAVVPTHFHQDCMGGLAEAHRRGATSYGLDKTIALAKRDHLPVPQFSFQLRTALHCGTSMVLVTHFGTAHTTDNVVAWLPKQRILFGGCLVKPLDASSLGNTSDGDLTAFPATLKKVKTAYPSARIVVPGHGDWGGTGLIDHTLKLCKSRAQ